MKGLTMIYYKIEMHHNEKTFESLSRMQYDLFCASNRITRTILSILLIAGGIINLSEWWGILLAAYGCYLTTSTYSSANHTAHKLAEQIKKSGMPFPASRYEFRENHLEVYSLPKNTRESTLAYNEFEKLGEDRDYFYLFRDSYGGYMVPKKGIDAGMGSRSNSDESQNLKAIGAFREFLENKSGKRIYRKTIPLVRVMQALKKKR